MTEDFIFGGGLIISFLAAIIFILEDLLPSLYKFIFRKLNIGLKQLDNFKQPPLGGLMAELTWKEKGFLEMYKMLKHFFPHLPPPRLKSKSTKNEKMIISICVESVLDFSMPQGVTATPVFALDTFKKKYKLMSRDALLWFCSTYRQRVLNRAGFFLLMLSIIMQLLLIRG